MQLLLLSIISVLIQDTLSRVWFIIFFCKKIQDHPLIIDSFSSGREYSRRECIRTRDNCDDKRNSWVITIRTIRDRKIFTIERYSLPETTFQRPLIHSSSFIPNWDGNSHFNWFMHQNAYETAWAEIWWVTICPSFTMNTCNIISVSNMYIFRWASLLQSWNFSSE